jgi:hypothetical protein
MQPTGCMASFTLVTFQKKHFESLFLTLFLPTFVARKKKIIRITTKLTASFPFGKEYILLKCKEIYYAFCSRR